MQSPNPYRLTGFADEISPDLAVQARTLQRLGLDGLDLRSVAGVNILDMPLEDVERVNDVCREHGILVQSIGSPINKIHFDVMLQGRERERLRRAVKAASVIHVKRIRIFAPEVPDPLDLQTSNRVMAWMSDQRRMAEDFNVTLIIENDATFWSAYPQNARRMFEELGSAHFKAVFDFSNAVLLGTKPLDDWFPWILPWLDTIHIKDAKDGKIVPAGEGDSQMVETFKLLIAHNWDGVVTLEPHLSAAGPYGGFSGEQLFETAVTALRRVLSEAASGAHEESGTGA